MTNRDEITIWASIIQALSTLILVIITYFQMAHAKKSISSMDNSMKADFLPIIVLGLIKRKSSSRTLAITLSNCGKGIAIKPKIIFPGKTDLIMNSLNINEVGNANIEYDKDFIMTKTLKSDRRIVIEYNDVFNRKIITHADLIEVNDLGMEENQQGIAWEKWMPIIPNDISETPNTFLRIKEWFLKNK